ncbi:MAG: hypothetical protein AB7P17_11605 [Nitrospirales bacterium]|nr:hypothetical protein [Nitrospirales bacterium]
MSGIDQKVVAVRQYAWILLILTCFFMFRVMAQLIQVWHPVAFLPSFDIWQSGALPYPLLVATQIVILVVCLRIVWRMFRGVVVPIHKKGKKLWSLGGVYFVTMSIRLVLGFTVAPDHFWLGATLPTVFHLVLAAFLLIYGRFHLQEAGTTKTVPQAVQA